MRSPFLSLALALGMPLFVEASEKEVSDRAIRLSHLAKDEIAIVARLQSMRRATEELPASWRAPAFDGSGEEIDREALIAEITELEISAAERWNIILNNLARLEEKRAKPTAATKHWREGLESLALRHKAMNKKLDHYHSRLQEGILMNLAKQIEMSAVQPPSLD
ncbi:MAG: hypothetical protein EA369_00785 [Bradymonadales bacterium]|nr:MAG: hypothetical protein EA369_00785 [Bradymonadales bacterium]